MIWLIWTTFIGAALLATAANYFLGFSSRAPRAGGRRPLRLRVRDDGRDDGQALVPGRGRVRGGGGGHGRLPSVGVHHPGHRVGRSSSSSPAPPCTRSASAASPPEPKPGWSDRMDSVRLAILGALAASRVGMEHSDVLRALDTAGVDAATAGRVLRGARLVRRRARPRRCLAGADAVRDPGPARAARRDRARARSFAAAARAGAVSLRALAHRGADVLDRRACRINYAWTPRRLAPLLPAPLEPEVHKGHGWVQVLMSSLRDMRPPGIPSLFGTCFYQVSYRAAVRYRDAGARGGGAGTSCAARRIIPSCARWEMRSRSSSSTTSGPRTW